MAIQLETAETHIDTMGVDAALQALSALTAGRGTIETTPTIESPGVPARSPAPGEPAPPAGPAPRAEPIAPAQQAVIRDTGVPAARLTPPAEPPPRDLPRAFLVSPPLPRPATRERVPRVPRLSSPPPRAGEEAVEHAGSAWGSRIEGERAIPPGADRAPVSLSPLPPFPPSLSPPPPTQDLGPLLSAIAAQTAVLQRIATLLEKQPQPTPPTY